MSEPVLLRPSSRTVIAAAPWEGPHAAGHEAAWTLLHRLLLLRGIDPETLRIGRTVRGKPFFETLSSLHCSLSHGRRYAAAALSDRPVGVDIEQIRPVSDRVAMRFLDVHPALYSPLPGDIGRILMWTRLESYAKMTGEGVPVREIGCPHQFTTYYHIPGHVLTVCEDVSAP